MATNSKLAEIPKFRNKPLSCSFSSEDIDKSPSLEYQVSHFPNISLSINSSGDDSDEVEYIIGKNSEILTAVKGKLYELKKNSNQAFEPIFVAENFDKLRSVNCYSAAPQTLGASSANYKLTAANKFRSSKLHEMKVSLQSSRKDLQQGLKIIKKISEENEEFNKKLEEIRCRIEKTELEEKTYSIGCKCEVF